MKIIKINVFQCSTPFKYAFHSPHIRRIKADSIVVELQFDNGISGYGESAPRPYVTGETSSSVLDTIKDNFAKILFHHEINSHEDVEKTLDALEKECFDSNHTMYNFALGGGWPFWPGILSQRIASNDLLQVLDNFEYITTLRKLFCFHRMLLPFLIFHNRKD